MFIYTFVFVSGVVVGKMTKRNVVDFFSIRFSVLATILPDLAGHHFKQPYGKEYGEKLEKKKKRRLEFSSRFQALWQKNWFKIYRNI